MSEQPTLEARVSHLEREMETMKQRTLREPNTSPRPSWLDVMAGAFENNDAFDEVLRLGREFRESQNHSGQTNVSAGDGDVPA